MSCREAQKADVQRAAKACAHPDECDCVADRELAHALAHRRHHARALGAQREAAWHGSNSTASRRVSAANKTYVPRRASLR
jgi:hypothetical protein